MSQHSKRLLVVPALSGIAFILMGALFTGSAQTPPPQGPEAAPSETQTFTAAQLTDLVAPIALYPDGLLSQVLVASTYPLEVVEAQQWLQGNRGLSAAELIDAAKQQPWDASVQALVAFPDVLQRLNQDVRWTGSLGDAFLAQPADVMAAVQQLRASAEDNGRLMSTPQQTVSTETQGDQSAIVIQPTNSDMVYVPAYDPSYIWGPPAWGSYPALYYPAYGFGWGPGVDLGYWDGWGWGPNWFGGTVIVDNDFFHRHGFVGVRGGGFHRERWVHNPDHRLGVPYGNAQLAGRFQGASRVNRGEIGARPAMPGNVQGFRDMSPRVLPQGGASRGFAAPQRPPMVVAPRVNPGFGGGAMRGFGGGGHFGGGRGFGGGGRR